jgi:hypothetical protein
VVAAAATAGSAAVLADAGQVRCEAPAAATAVISLYSQSCCHVSLVCGCGTAATCTNGCRVLPSTTLLTMHT